MPFTCLLNDLYLPAAELPVTEWSVSAIAFLLYRNHINHTAMWNIFHVDISSLIDFPIRFESLDVLESLIILSFLSPTETRAELSVKSDRMLSFLARIVRLKNYEANICNWICWIKAKYLHVGVSYNKNLCELIFNNQQKDPLMVPAPNHSRGSFKNIACFNTDDWHFLQSVMSIL